MAHYRKTVTKDICKTLKGLGLAQLIVLVSLLVKFHSQNYRV